MERLTKKLSDGTYMARLERLSNGKFAGEKMCLAKLGKLEDLEEQGRLIELSCKVGDDIYFIPSKTNYKLNVLNHLEENNRVYHQKIERITIAKKYYIVECDADREYGTGRYFINDSFGETWFLTKEEALAKLEELKEGAK